MVEAVTTYEGQVTIMKWRGKNLREVIQVDEVVFHCFPILIIEQFFEILEVHMFPIWARSAWSKNALKHLGDQVQGDPNPCGQWYGGIIAKASFNSVGNSMIMLNQKHNGAAIFGFFPFLILEEVVRAG
jgi:hypothetical protein